MVPVAVYVLALATILYPAYGPSSYIREGHGTATSVLVYAGVSLVLAAVFFGTPVLSRPLWALVAAILALLLSIGPTDTTGVPVVVGAAAAYYGRRAGAARGSDKVATAAFLVGSLAVIVTLAIVFLEPLTD